MKKFKVIFLLSFASYFLLLCVSPYVTAKIFADMIFFIFLISIAYQILFIVLLRNKVGISLKRSISIFFLYAMSSISCYIVMRYIYIFFNGKRVSAFLTGENIATYYGFDAWIHNAWDNIVFLPFLLLNVIYAAIYFTVSRLIKKRIKQK